MTPRDCPCCGEPNGVLWYAGYGGRIEPREPAGYQCRACGEKMVEGRPEPELPRVSEIRRGRLVLGRWRLADQVQPVRRRGLGRADRQLMGVL